MKPVEIKDEYHYKCREIAAERDKLKEEYKILMTHTEKLMNHIERLNSLVTEMQAAIK